MEMWAALLGAAIGGGASALTAYVVYKSERARRNAEQFAGLRRDLTVAFVRDLSDLRECIANPTRNQNRQPGVESSLATSYALFVAHLHADEAPVSEFAHRLKHAVRYAATLDSVWSDEEALRRQGIEPLLRWSATDAHITAAWFSANLSANQSAFNRSKFNLAPSAE